jgi:hypothetical protein
MPEKRAVVLLVVVNQQWLDSRRVRKKELSPQRLGPRLAQFGCQKEPLTGIIGRHAGELRGCRNGDAQHSEEEYSHAAALLRGPDFQVNGGADVKLAHTIE